MNSQEEDALFEKWGWEKDLIQRCYRSPVGGIVITYDDLVALTSSPEGQRELITGIVRYGISNENLQT